MKLKSIFVAILSVLFVYSFGQSTVQYKPTKHYTGIANTGSNMTLGIPLTAWDVVPEVGDEIGAFNEHGKLVGSTVFLGSNSAITIWGDDETTSNKEGTQTGTRYTLRLWHNESNAEDVIVVKTWLQGDDIYETNGISVIDKVGLEEFIIGQGEYVLGQNIPNPANSMTKIEFSIPAQKPVKIAIYSAGGKMIRELLSEDLAAGKHQVEFNVSDLAAGTYYYKLMTSDYTSTKAMNVVR